MPASLRNKVTMRAVARRLRNQGFSMREKLAGDDRGGGHRLPCGLRDGWGGARMMGNGVRVSFPHGPPRELRCGSAAVPPRLRADFGAVPPRFRAVPRGSARLRVRAE